MNSFNGNVRRSIYSSVLVKFAVCFLLMGISYRLFCSSWVQFSPIEVNNDESGWSLENTFVDTPKSSDTDDDVFLPSQNETCNLFIGDWVPDPNGPMYTNASCNIIEGPQDCMKNGRPDSDYVYWRWNPKECDLSRIDPKKFLKFMRNKSLALIGDSIMRNHVQSLLCILSQVEPAVLVYHDETYRNRRWSFRSYHFNVSVVWAPFIMKAETFEDENGVSSGIIQLHLDNLDKIWTQQYENFDYVLIAGGKWFLKSAIYYENNKIVGCHNCNNENITELGFVHAYQKALNSTLKFIINSKHKPHLLFRTTTPDHFENGEWNSGGYCNRTRPFKDGEVGLIDIDEMMRKIEIEELEWAMENGAEKGLRLKLLDTTLLSLLRPDGHPGVYRQFHPYEGKDKDAKIQNDCLHWCLPGPIDSWNAIMMEMLLRRWA